MRGDEAFIHRMIDSWQKDGLEMFAAGISADCTSERLQLPFLGFDQDMAHLCRSSWHVMASVVKRPGVQGEHEALS